MRNQRNNTEFFGPTQTSDGKTTKVNQQKEDMPSVFGFKDNGNKIIDKEDFSDVDMYNFAKEKGFIGKDWDSIGNFAEMFKASNKTEGSQQTDAKGDFVNNTLANVEKGTQAATVQFGQVDSTIGINRNPVMHIDVDGDKVILTPFKNGQKGTPIEMTKEEFTQKCNNENGVIEAFDTQE